MARYIDADLLKNEFNYKDADTNEGIAWIGTIRRAIKNAPTADVAEMVHAEWIETGNYITTAYSSIDIYQCSNCECDIAVDGYDDFCPNCGAKMDKESD